jgi:hypothetical protein
MKYNQPYGISDPNGAYINGDPSTGTQGSIPPAASIEYPQREIVNMLTYSSLTPGNADLAQLSKAIQSGVVNFALDTGLVNQIAITPTLPITSYKLGLRFIVKMGFQNTSNMTVNVSSVGSVQLVHTDGTQINAWELIAGQLIDIAYDGTKFQLIAGGVAGGVVTLKAPQHLYVNNTTGNDTFDGTSPTISGAVTGPFKTVQRALVVMQQYNLGGWDFYIHVADGTYSSTLPVDFPVPNGSGRVHMVGNASNPAAVSIINSGNGSAWRMFNGGNYFIDGFAFSSTAALAGSGDNGNGIWIQGGTYLNINAVSWGSVPAVHFLCGPNASALVFGPITITGGAPTAHQHAYANGTLYNNIPTTPNLTISSAVTIGTFCWATNGGQARPMYGTITGAGNVTGKKYDAIGNGVVDSNGRGVSYLPGTVAGTTSTGGQYL